MFSKNCCCWWCICVFYGSMVVWGRWISLNVLAYARPFEVVFVRYLLRQHKHEKKKNNTLFANNGTRRKHASSWGVPLISCVYRMYVHTSGCWRCVHPKTQEHLRIFSVRDVRASTLTKRAFSGLLCLPLPHNKTQYIYRSRAFHTHNAALLYVEL